MGKLWKSFCADLHRKEFIPLKVLNFFMYGAILAFFPFLTLHAREIGITETEYGMISGVLPAMCVFIPALSGMIADKIGNFKLFSSIMMIATGFTGLLFTVVPRRGVQYYLQEQANLTFECTAAGDIWNDMPNCLNGSTHMQSLDIDCIYHNTNGTKDLLEFPQEFPDASSSLEIHDFLRTECAQINETLNWNGSLLCTGTVTRTGCLLPEEFVYDPQTVLIIYTLVRVVNNVFLAASLPLMESAVVSIVKEKNGDLGFQKLYNNIGIIIMTPLSGFLIDLFSTETRTNFRPSFYLFCGLNCLNGIIIFFVDLKFKVPSQTVLKDFKSLLKNVQVILLLFIAFSTGLVFGVLDTFLFWLLDDLGADKSFMGLTVTVGCTFGIPLVFLSTSILEKFGHVNTISVCSMIFVIRLLGYSYIPTAWWAMPFEALESFSVSLLMIAIISYASLLSSASTVATLQSILTGTLHAFGRGAGGFVGGFLVSSFGLRVSFRFVAVYIGLASFIYFTLNKTLFKPQKHDANANGNSKTPQNGLTEAKNLLPNEQLDTTKV